MTSLKRMMLAAAGIATRNLLATIAIGLAAFFIFKLFI